MKAGTAKALGLDRLVFREPALVLPPAHGPPHMTDTARPILAILCPVYNEEEAIPLFFGRLQPVAAGLAERYLVRLVFLNNASHDRTMELIEEIRQRFAE